MKAAGLLKCLWPFRGHQEPTVWMSCFGPGFIAFLANVRIEIEIWGYGKRTNAISMLKNFFQCLLHLGKSGTWYFAI